MAAQDGIDPIRSDAEITKIHINFMKIVVGIRVNT